MCALARIIFSALDLKCHLGGPKGPHSSAEPTAQEGPGLGGHRSGRLQARRGAKSLMEEAGDPVPFLPRPPSLGFRTRDLKSPRSPLVG